MIVKTIIANTKIIINKQPHLIDFDPGTLILRVVRIKDGKVKVKEQFETYDEGRAKFDSIIFDYDENNLGK